MNKNQLWSAVLQRLSEKITRMEFLTWFQKVQIIEIRGNAILLGCPTEMSKNWIENKYSNIVLSNIKAILPEIENIYFEVKLELADTKPNKASEKLSKPKGPRKLPNQPEVQFSDGLRSRITNPKFNLDNFIVGPENQFAHAACSAIANTLTTEERKYNPLFIFGGVGLGKTHLLQGTANDFQKKNPNAKVIYNTAERFINEIIKAIKERKMDSLRKKYRTVDALFLDDIQFFEGKEKTQDELFNTFNDLYEFNKQIVFSADRTPSELLGISDRLRSRLGWGLTADVQMPGYETRIAIIQEKSSEKKLFIPPDVQDFIANNVRTNLRELENTLNQISAEIDLNKESPTIQSVAKILRKSHPNEDFIAQRNKNTGIVNSPDDIITLVSEYFQIPATEILGTIRKKEIVFARQICWLLCKEILKMSLDAIGKDFGGKNHTTIMHGIKKIQTLSRDDSATARHIHALRKDLGIR